MQKYQNNVQTLDGRAIVGASVTVTEYPGGAPATVYNANGSGVITQPILTNGDGEFAFYAANGRYQLQITGGGISVAQTITDVILFDPSEAIDASEDAGDLAGDEFVPVSRGSGVLKTTLTAIAQWVLQTFQGFTQSGAGAISRTLQSKNSDTKNAKDWGAVSTPGVDNSSAIQAAIDACTAGGGTLEITERYEANGLLLTCNMEMSATGEIKFNGATNGTALEIPASASGLVVPRVRVHGNGMNCTPFRVSGDNNEIGDVYVSNVTATAAGDTSFVGVGLNGAGNSVRTIHVRDFINDGHSNGSFPQAVFVFGAGNSIGEIIVRNGRAALVTSTASEVTTVGRLDCYGMLDNGIYQLGGVLTLGELIYHGDEEPAVFQGSGSVGKITIVGDTNSGLGFDNIGEMQIDHIHVVPDAAGNSAKFLFRTRALNVAAGRLSIGKITGTLKGSSLFAISVGTFEYLEIGSMRVRFMYDAAIATSLTAWADIRSCKGFRLNDINVEIIDINNVATGSTLFTMLAPTTNLAKKSFVSGIQAVVYNSDLVTASPAGFRGTDFAQALIETEGVYWRTDIGPYLEKRQDRPVDSANAIPTLGTWNRGKRLVSGFPAAGGSEGWVCVLSGTPGTWKTFGTIAA